MYTDSMRVNIYIRKENQEAWGKIPDKSNWINALLENSSDTSRYGKVRDTPAGKFVEVLSEDLPVLNDVEDVRKVAKSLAEEKNFDFCKHGSVKGLCKLGCK